MVGRFCLKLRGLKMARRRVLASRFLGLLLAVASSVAWGSVAIGAEPRYEVGDEVEVLHHHKWKPATILNMDRRGAVLAEYEFAGSFQRGGFTPSQVRLQCEAGAIGLVREWKDASGKFRIRAAAVEIDEGKVLLRKLDMEELDVEIAKLSSSDQRYVARLQKEGASNAPRMAKVPPVEQFASTGSFSSTSMSFGSGSERKALDPDPLPTYVRLKQGGTGFPVDGFSQRIGAVLPVGGPDGWVLASVEDDSGLQPVPTQLLWVSLVRQKIESKIALPPGEKVLDYHPRSHRLLTSASQESSMGARREPLLLTVWEVLPTDKNVTAVVRWDTADGTPGERSSWARLTDGNTVLQCLHDQEYVAWDLSAKAMRYRLNQEAFFSPKPTLSGGRKYLFMPEDERVSIYDTKTGGVLSILPVTSGASAVAVSEDGRRAATLGRNTLMVWDLTDANAEPQEYQAESIGSPFGDLSLDWISGNRLLAGRGVRGLVLFDLKHQAALWNYVFDLKAVSEGVHGGRVREIVAGHLVYAASIGGLERGLAVGAVSLPGPQVDEAIATFDPESLLIMKAGSRVRLEVTAGEYGDRVRAALEPKLAANGWVLDESAPNVVTAEMKRGETQDVTYDFRGKRPNETVSITPHISLVRIVCNDKEAWVASTRTGVPMTVRLREGQSLQAEVNRLQNPNPEFFDTVVIPQKISDPSKRTGLGTTQVTNRGLVVGASRGPQMSKPGGFPRGRRR